MVTIPALLNVFDVKSHEGSAKLRVDAYVLAEQAVQ